MAENLEDKTNKEDITMPSNKDMIKYFARSLGVGGVSSVIGYCVDNALGGDGYKGTVLGVGLGTMIGMFYNAYFKEDWISKKHQNGKKD